MVMPGRQQAPRTIRFQAVLPIGAEDMRSHSDMADAGFTVWQGDIPEPTAIAILLR